MIWWVHIALSHMLCSRLDYHHSIPTRPRHSCCAFFRKDHEHDDGAADKFFVQSFSTNTTFRQLTGFALNASIDSSGEALDVLAWGMQLPAAALPVAAGLATTSLQKQERMKDWFEARAFSKSFWQTTDGKICQIEKMFKHLLVVKVNCKKLASSSPP